ncbi:MAG: bactofilin family protein [Candidatus Hydrogenedens sp.]
MSKDEEKKESKSLFGKLRFGNLNEVWSANRKPQEEIVKPQEKVEEKKTVVPQEPTRQIVKENESITISKPQKTGLKIMVIPENVYIEGSIRGECDSEIYGKINGNIQIKGNLVLGKTAEVKGSIKSMSASIDGIVEGKIETTNDVEIGPNSKIQAELISGQKIIVSGQVNGSICAEVGVKLQQSAKLNGDIIALKWFSIQEGAVFNGNCSMKRTEQTPKPQPTEQPKNIQQSSPSVHVNLQNQQIKK